MTSKKIMGLDISSSTVGICILTQYDGYVELTHVEYYKPQKKGHIFERLSVLKKYIEVFLEKWQPDEIAIEDILMGFHGRMTTINTISLLAIFNRTVGLTIYESCGKIPYMYAPMEIRKAISIDDVVPDKEQVPEFMERHLQTPFPWIKKKNRNTKRDQIIIENFDMADSMGCAYCHILIGSGREYFVVKKKSKKTKPTTKKSKKK